MLCERLDDRTGIFLKSNLFIGIIYIYFHQLWLCRCLKEKSVGKEMGSLFREFVIGVIYIYFHANIYYHISMKGESI